MQRIKFTTLSSSIVWPPEIRDSNQILGDEILNNFAISRMSDPRLSFYPAEEDVGGPGWVVAREPPGQLEQVFRSCRLVSSELLSEAQQAASTASSQAQGELQSRNVCL